MGIFFVIIIVLAFYHFIYESTIAPNIRYMTRFKLFKLRDELINLKINNSEAISDEVFNELERTINLVINRLSLLTISAQFQSIVKYEEDDSFKKRLDKKKFLLDSCKNDRVKEIDKEILIVASEMFLINSGGWFPILIPIIILMLLFALITSTANSINNLILRQFYKMAYASDHDFPIESPINTSF